MSRDPQELIRSGVRIASLPLIFTRVNEAVNNPRTSLGEVARIISEDSGLSARLLRIVNSAFYSFPSRIETISHAVSIVGTEQLRDLALATTVMTIFKGLPEDLVNMESFWQHSIAVGVAARQLATRRRETNTERYFVAGLLHDIGRLIIYLKIPEEARKVISRSLQEQKPMIEAEREVLGFDHAAVGGAMLNVWKLPRSLEEIVAYHHQPMLARSFQFETAVIHIADIMAHALQLGSSGESMVPKLVEQAWDTLEMNPGSFLSILKQMDGQYEETTQFILRN
jgi:putative nucleotidyltransferase with HDIG domain